MGFKLINGSVKLLVSPFKGIVDALSSARLWTCFRELKDSLRIRGHLHSKESAK